MVHPAATVVAVVVREKHVVHLLAARIDAQNVPRNPLARVAFESGKDRHGVLAALVRRDVAAVDEQRRAVWVDQKDGLRHAGVDEVNLEMPFSPRRKRTSNGRMLRSGGERLREQRRPRRHRTRRYRAPHNKITSVHRSYPHIT